MAELAKQYIKIYMEKVYSYPSPHVPYFISPPTLGNYFCFFFLNLLFCIWVQLINNVVIVSGGQLKRLSHTYQFSSVQSLSRVQLFPTPWIAARQASLSITSSWSLPRLMFIELVTPSISSSVVPFPFCPQSFPAWGSFQTSQLFTSGGQSIGVSAIHTYVSILSQTLLPTRLLYTYTAERRSMCYRVGPC